MTPTTATTLARAMFGRLFDNAAMYPPARAPMEAAIALHDATERSAWGFARGRLLCPGARVADLDRELRLLGRDNRALRIGVVVGSPADENATAALERVLEDVGVLAVTTPAVHVDLLEVRPATQDPDSFAAEARHACAAADDAGIDNLFVEVDVAGEDAGVIRARVEALAEVGHDHRVRVGAKVRCGGLEPGMVPSRAQLAVFLRASRASRMPFKATAGLHHAFADPDGAHHGFVSLLVASMMNSTLGLDDGAVAELLATPPGRIALDDETLAVTSPGTGAVLLTVDDVTNARYAGFVAFGTCSFTEPALEVARLLGAEA